MANYIRWAFANRHHSLSQFTRVKIGYRSNSYRLVLRFNSSNKRTFNMKVIIFIVWSIVFIGTASHATRSIVEISNKPAPVDKYLFTASISVAAEHICTGIILNNRWLLTSAMCLVNYNDNFQLIVIYYGSHDRTNVQRTKNAIEKIVIHPEFDKKNLINNLALVKVNRSIAFIPTVVQAAQLSAKHFGENDTAIAIGWEKADQPVCCYEMFFS